METVINLLLFKQTLIDNKVIDVNVNYWHCMFITKWTMRRQKVSTTFEIDWVYFYYSILRLFSTFCAWTNILSYLSHHYQGHNAHSLLLIGAGFILDLFYTLVCKEFSHTLCGPKGSYCDGDVTEPEQFDGLPTSISKYPHTVGH